MLTGNYFRMLRILNILVILFATPVYLAFAEGAVPVHEVIRFFITDGRICDKHILAVPAA